ncbi:FliO/MopB family protein [Thermodesulforhabdus norvegica]|uniref:Flagellar biosynthesis protein, FliO n=1 Tax=Thermodesulforhabdus norvegica TaxID=39841 RepID=A0A1I4R6E7_9BACT|nr:flagellar biosynthetic protein FliO [Thermodesulforhabdus norvegica]SFM47520.1 Flagellar biosynthesis protein, FliO [Thermodesulforhabdus norvegica]
MDPTFVHALIKIVIALFGIICLLVLVYFFFRKKGLYVTGIGKGRLISVVERQYLSPKTYLAHVEWAGKALLIAVTPAGVYVVKEMDGDTDGRSALLSKGDR